MQEPLTAPDPQVMPPAVSRWANVALVTFSIFASLFVIEIGYRLAAGLSIFKLVDWRTQMVSINRLGERAVFDPVLGWRVKPHSDIDRFEAIDYGVRRNFNETGIRTGAVLAVGDSFTEGWEVEDEESWPAVLEQLSGVPVVNAGVGGYGTDQIVLRAEQMLPIAKPKILIVGFLQSDIFRAGHSIFGAPKPYFTLEDGALRYHPPEPLEPRAQSGLLSSLSRKVRDGLGDSAAADYIFARLNPDYWYSEGKQVSLRKADIDPAEVTCALLARLKAQTDRDGIQSMLFMQYYAEALLEMDQPPDDSQRVMTCARKLGMRVVDQFASLRRLVLANRTVLSQH